MINSNKSKKKSLLSIKQQKTLKNIKKGVASEPDSISVPRRSRSRSVPRRSRSSSVPRSSRSRSVPRSSRRSSVPRSSRRSSVPRSSPSLFTIKDNSKNPNNNLNILLMQLVLNSIKLDTDITVYSAQPQEFIDNPDKIYDESGISLHNSTRLATTLINKCVIEDITKTRGSRDISWWKRRPCYKITIPKGTPILPIFNSAVHFNEFEALLPPYLKLVKDESSIIDKCYLPYFDDASSNWTRIITDCEKEYGPFNFTGDKKYDDFFETLNKTYKLDINNKNSLYYRIIDNQSKTKNFIILCDDEGNLAWIESYPNGSETCYYLKQLIYFYDYVGYNTDDGSDKITDYPENVPLDGFGSKIHYIKKTDVTSEMNTVFDDKTKTDEIKLSTLSIDVNSYSYKYNSHINNEYIFYNLNTFNNLTDLQFYIIDTYKDKPEDIGNFDRYQNIWLSLYGYLYVKLYRDNPIEIDKCKSINNYKVVIDYDINNAKKTINKYVKDSKITLSKNSNNNNNKETDNIRKIVINNRLDCCLLNTIITSISIGLPAQDKDITNFTILKKYLYEYILKLNHNDRLIIDNYGLGATA